jgi:hypothetical protein
MGLGELAGGYLIHIRDPNHLRVTQALDKAGMVFGHPAAAHNSDTQPSMLIVIRIHVYLEIIA